MILEVGKSYVTSYNGVIARCICVDRAWKGAKAAMLLYTGSTGDEYTLHTHVDGTVLTSRGPFVVKEYIPPVKVRVLLIKYESKPPYSSSVIEGSENFASTPEKMGYTAKHGYTVLSDTIVEVPSA